jgi:hypothetical protein
MKAHKGFSTVVINKEDFKVAKSRTQLPPSEWKPKPHMFAERMEEQKKIRSLWTPTIPHKDFRK